MMEVSTLLFVIVLYVSTIGAPQAPAAPAQTTTMQGKFTFHYSNVNPIIHMIGTQRIPSPNLSTFRQSECFEEFRNHYLIVHLKVTVAGKKAQEISD